MERAGTKLDANAPGKYYVTSECNGCGLCYSVALQCFMYNTDASYYYIHQQPQDPREEQDILEAMEVCPMDCIHDDGPTAS